MQRSTLRKRNIQINRAKANDWDWLIESGQKMGMRMGAGDAFVEKEG